MTFTVLELHASGDSGERLLWGADNAGHWQCYHVERATWQRKPEYDRDTAEELGVVGHDVVTALPTVRAPHVQGGGG